MPSGEEYERAAPRHHGAGYAAPHASIAPCRRAQKPEWGTCSSSAAPRTSCASGDPEPVRRLAGGADARIAVISTASSLGDEATELYRRSSAWLVRARPAPLTREDANDEPRPPCDEATGIFMTGGNQLRLSS